MRWVLCVLLISFITSCSAPEEQTVLVIGVDGMAWNILQPLIDQGRVPNLQNLIEQGSSGELQTIFPTNSPSIWTSIATGKTPDKHGITLFTVTDPDEVDSYLLTSTRRRVKALWNMLTHHKISSATISWWASYPAEPVNGLIISDHLGEQDSTYPPDKFDSLIVQAEGTSENIDLRQLTGYGDEFYSYLTGMEDIYAEMFESSYRGDIMAYLLFKGIRGQTDVTLVYLEHTDTISHIFCRFHESEMFSDVTRQEAMLFGSVLEDYYVFIDALIGRMADGYTNIIIVSDHGFRLGADTNNTILCCQHQDAPPGVLIMSGPEIRKKNQIVDASVLDITPTLLYLLGLPVGRDMDGSIITEAFTDDFRQNHHPQYIETYDIPSNATELKIPADPEYLEHLRALGYI
ncbi:MAG: alkaline phosphatase family protein [archaeon]